MRDVRGFGRNGVGTISRNRHNFGKVWDNAKVQASKYQFAKSTEICRITKLITIISQVKWSAIWILSQYQEVVGILIKDYVLNL